MRMQINKFLNIPNIIFKSVVAILAASLAYYGAGLNESLLSQTTEITDIKQELTTIHNLVDPDRDNDNHKSVDCNK